MLEMTRETGARSQPRRAILVPLVVAFSMVCFSSLNAQGQALDVTYKNGLLSVSATDADPQEVLARISQEAAVIVDVPGDLAGSVTIRFDKLPLEEALHRILRGMSYALIFFRSDQEDAKATVSGVFVFSQGAGTPASGHGARTSIERRGRDEREIESEDEEEQEVEPAGLGEEDVAVENREDEEEKQPEPEVEQKYLTVARLESRLDALEEHLERIGADNARAAAIKREILSLESQMEKLLQE
jgi:hypothetical protein